jgi:hypothetical protein
MAPLVHAFDVSYVRQTFARAAFSAMIQNELVVRAKDESVCGWIGIIKATLSSIIDTFSIEEILTGRFGNKEFNSRHERCRREDGSNESNSEHIVINQVSNE